MSLRGGGVQQTGIMPQRRADFLPAREGDDEVVLVAINVGDGGG